MELHPTDKLVVTTLDRAMRGVQMAMKEDNKLVLVGFAEMRHLQGCFHSDCPILTLNVKDFFTAMMRN